MIRSLTLAACLLAGAATAQESMPEPEEGRAIFEENCAVCHGSSGMGNGPWAGSYNPSPADLTALKEDGVFSAHGSCR